MASGSLHPPLVAKSGARGAVAWYFVAAIGAASLAALIAWAAVVAGGRSEADGLPVLAELPPFELLNERGERFGSADLRGKAWVANFIFTRCPTVCPVLTRKMGSLQPVAQESGGALHLVSISVDPDFDRPDVLRAYAEKAGADPARWTFLTGDAASVRATVLEGFKVSIGRSGSPDDVAGIFHGTHFVLVDSGGWVRGYYASEDSAAVGKLRRDMARLARTVAAR
jgi:protein SCO1/2